jgi:hypothetical protein
MRNKDDYRDYFYHFDAPLLLVRVATDAAGFFGAEVRPFD